MDIMCLRVLATGAMVRTSLQKQNASNTWSIDQGMSEHTVHSDDAGLFYNQKHTSF